MVNEAQKALLNDLVGCNGIYTTTINDFTHETEGTKLLYLKRAITLQGIHFLESLDQLYKENIDDQLKPEYIDLIRSLKMINNLYFNQEINYDEYGIRFTLDHYFSRIGSVNPDEFKTYIHESIEEITGEYYPQEEASIEHDILTRLELERSKKGAPHWRNELDFLTQSEKVRPAIVRFDSIFRFVGSGRLIAEFVVDEGVLAPTPA